MLTHIGTLSILRFKGGEGEDFTHPTYVATLYTVGITMESSLNLHLTENRDLVFERNNEFFFSNETLSWLSTQEMQLFCSTATVSLHSRGYQPSSPDHYPTLSSACGKIAYQLKAEQHF